MADNWYAGNAADDGKQNRGWILGHFMTDPGDVRLSSAVEIKWGIHPAGEQRSSWQDTEERTTIVLLVRGRFRLELGAESVVLERGGDYAVWGPGIGTPGRPRRTRSSSRSDGLRPGSGGTAQRYRTVGGEPVPFRWRAPGSLGEMEGRQARRFGALPAINKP